MNWYYVDDGQQAGPVDDAGLGSLAASGKITGETLVWREGMANWQPYRELQPGGLRSSRGAVPLRAGAETATEGEAVCGECGNMFPLSETTRIGGVLVCANCKPVVLQKMREGVGVGTTVVYAGFWIRLAAKILDSLVLGVFAFAFFFALGLVVALGSGSHDPEKMRENGRLVGNLAPFIWIPVVMAYSGFFLSRFGATPGKMACKLKVVDGNGGGVGFGRGCVRVLAEVVSGIICYAGYIMAAFDREKRALHDRICNTRVIYK
jgi:uncharacterized RDD family membrane protein YckC